MVLGHSNPIIWEQKWNPCKGVLGIYTGHKDCVAVSGRILRIVLRDYMGAAVGSGSKVESLENKSRV